MVNYGASGSQLVQQSSHTGHKDILHPHAWILYAASDFWLFWQYSHTDHKGIFQPHAWFLHVPQIYSQSDTLIFWMEVEQILDSLKYENYFIKCCDNKLMFVFRNN